MLVYSLAGGSGKTSLVANAGRALSSLGEKVLLAETTGRGLLPLYFGGRDHRNTGVRRFPSPNRGSAGSVDLINYEGAARGSDSSRSDRDLHGAITQDLAEHARRADRVLIDTGVGCDWLAARIAWMNPTIRVPLAADLNPVASLASVERNCNVLQSAEGRPLEPVYLLNQFDASMVLHCEVRDGLREQLGEWLLPCTIRRSSAVSEALAEGRTIVDHDTESEVAKDFVAVAERLRNTCRRRRRAFTTSMVGRPIAVPAVAQPMHKT